MFMLQAAVPGEVTEETQVTEPSATKVVCAQESVDTLISGKKPRRQARITNREKRLDSWVLDRDVGKVGTRPLPDRDGSM